MSRRGTWRRLAPLLVLVSATFLVVGACADDGDEASPTPSDDTAQPTASPGDVTAAPVTFPASIAACDLMRIDELVRLLGNDPVDASGSQGAGTDAAFCTWVANYEGNISSVSLQITTSRTGFDDFRNEPGYEPLEGVGDEAYMQTADDLPSGLLNSSIIVKDGIYYVLLLVGGPLERNEARDEMPTILQRLLRDLPQ